MKNCLIIAFFIVVQFCTGQNVENSNILHIIKSQDVSHLWNYGKIIWFAEGDTTTVKRPEFLGYIGPNYQKFDIHFSSVVQDTSNRLKYFVNGKARVDKVIKTIRGNLIIYEARRFKKGIDTLFGMNLDTTLETGYIKGQYYFDEYLKSKLIGVLKGLFTTYIYLDKNNLVHYYFWPGDSFYNNQFEGLEELCKDTMKIKCNWGDYRIPDSKGLDCGASEFIPIDKYIKYGWAHYKKQFVGNTISIENTVNEEQEDTWWENK